MNRIKSVPYLALLLAFGTALQAADTGVTRHETRDGIIRLALKANAAQQAESAKTDEAGRDRAIWLSGLMEAYHAIGDPRFARQAMASGRQQEWGLGSGADVGCRLAYGDVWMDFYFHETDPALMEQSKGYAGDPPPSWTTKDPDVIQPLIAWLAADPSVGEGKASWIQAGNQVGADSLYGSPALLKLFKATGERKYLESFHAFWAGARAERFDKEQSLFYAGQGNSTRDAGAGRRSFAARDNGMAFSALARSLDALAGEELERGAYVEWYKAMSAALARSQGADGLWPANLAEPDRSSHPDRIGSALIVHGIGLGIEAGYLDKPTYLPVLKKGWRGLADRVDRDPGTPSAEPLAAGQGTQSEDAPGALETGAFLMASAAIYRHADEYTATVEPPRGDPMALLDKPMIVSDKFKRIVAPGTQDQNGGQGRTAVRLTSSGTASYPLYYFAPTFSKDGRYLIYHRYDGNTDGHTNGEVQLWRLDLHTAESAQLTHAKKTDRLGHTHWYGYAPGPKLRGVADYRSAVNQERNEVVYFDGIEARSVDISTLEDRLLFELPEGWAVQSQNCVSRDGKWFVYIRRQEPKKPMKEPAYREVMGYNFDTGERRLLWTIQSTSHHVQALNSQYFAVHHPPGSMGAMGMAFGDLTGGNWRLLRYGDPGLRDFSCHALPTARGFAYEAFSMVYSGKRRKLTPMRAGLYDPFSRKRLEWVLPDSWKYVHTGWDPLGRLFFWETARSLYYLERLDAQQGGQFKFIADCGKEYARMGQRPHPHPMLTPDRRWILYTGGDEETKSIQIFMVDISDLGDSAGVSTDLLSHTGANDVDAPGVVVP